MDYEQKYKEALERANQAIKECGANQGRIKMIESIFPELKESEDERIRKELMEISNTALKRQGTTLFGKNYDYKKWIAWLEKQGEQKPAWSEEDEGELYLTISLLDKLKEEAYTIDCENCINWLKSLKPQPHWKPTEEQMENLEYAINMVDKCCEDSLQSLYNDLEKL